MARKPRLHLPGAFYHVILRGNNKQQIFFSSQDREYFYFLLHDGIQRFHYRIHAFCLMNNHIHLLLQIGKIPLSKIMHNVTFRYTQLINKFQGKIGHLFQGRYKAILVDANSYLLELVRYIHLNPVRAGMVSQIEEYQWSSHRAYLNLDDIVWLTKNVVLTYFHAQYDVAMMHYVNFMKTTHSDTKALFKVESHTKYDILGDDAFLQDLQNQLIIEKKSTITFENIIQLTCSYYSITENDLKDLSRSHLFSKIRALIGWLTKEYKICSLSKCNAL